MEEKPERNYELDERTVFEGLNQYFLLFFALCCILSSVFIQEIFITINNFRLGITVAPLVGIVLPLFLLTRRFKPSFKSQLRIRTLQLSVSIYVILAALAMVVVVDYIYVISQQFMPEPEGYLEGLMALRPHGVWSTILTFLGLCIVVPVSEELVFRGVIQQVFARNMGHVIAMILAGVFFGVIHLNPQLLPSMIIFGVFLGFVFFVTDNLSYTILGHAALNSVAFLQLAAETGDELGTATFYIQDWWYFPVAVGIVIVLLKVIKRGATRPAPTPFEPSNDFDKR